VNLPSKCVVTTNANGDNTEPDDSADSADRGVWVVRDVQDVTTDIDTSGLQDELLGCNTPLQRTKTAYRPRRIRPGIASCSASCSVKVTELGINYFATVVVHPDHPKENTRRDPNPERGRILRCLRQR